MSWTRVRVSPRPPTFCLTNLVLCNIIRNVMTKEEAQNKVYELTEKLLYTKKDMKDVVSGYKEVIKEIESEIKAIVEETKVTN